MDYYKNASKIEEKLAEALTDENMILRTSSAKYPYTLNIVQDQSPGGQMMLYATSEGDTSSRDAAIRFIFNLDGLVIRTDSRVIVSDAFMNKIKGLAKKLHYAWLQAFYAEHTAEVKSDDTVEDDTEEADTEDCDNVQSDEAEDDPVDPVFDGFFGEPEDE